MTIDDELILVLLKPEKDGKVGKDAPIGKDIMGAYDLDYKLAQVDSFYSDHQAVIKKERTQICPDITIAVKTGNIRTVAIELENDLKWDFMESIEQVKKYKNKFETKIIIPADYIRFAPLYKNEGFRVYLWKAKRIWQCLKCKTETAKEGPFVPECSNSKCKNKSQDAFRLVRVEDASFEEFKEY
jgi:hypothetical protein